MTPFPRISFSFDLEAPLEKPNSPVQPSSSDFVFMIPSTGQPAPDLAVADELFSNGIILPLSSLPRTLQRDYYGGAPKSAMGKSSKPSCRRLVRRSKKVSCCYYYGTYKDSGAVCVSPVLNFSPSCGILSFFGLCKLLSTRCILKIRKKTPSQV